VIRALFHKPVSFRLQAKADEIHSLRRALTPVLDWLVASNNDAETKAFVDWDLAIWKLHDAYMREKAKLDSHGDLGAARTKEKLLKIDYDHLLSELEALKSKPWWEEANRVSQ